MSSSFAPSLAASGRVRRRFAGLVVATIVAVLGPLALFGAPARAATPVDYVALGDSYSAGAGTRSYIKDGTRCQRSSAAYPSLIAASHGYRLTLRACAGASVDEVRRTQLSALTSSTGVVSVGGNDAGFVDVLTQCALPSWLGDCTAALDKAQRVIANDLPGRWTGLFAEVRSRAPQARVVVVGYPRIFGSRDCNALTWFSDSERRRLNETADMLNAGLARAAAGAGAQFADPIPSFSGHAICDSQEWVNGLSMPVSGSFHPNKSGHVGYASVVASNLPARPFGVRVAAQRIDEKSIAASNARFRALHHTVTQEHFQAPDLTTPYARARAAQLGIDIDAFIACGAACE